MPFCHASLSARRPPNPAYPRVLETLGHHIRKRRLDLGLLQRELAERLGVSVDTVRKWERSRDEPEAAFLPRVLDFLSYDPRPKAIGIADRLKRARRGLGLTQQSLAKRLGIDESTVADYESGRPGVPNSRVRRQLLAFVEATGEGKSAQDGR